MYKRQVGSDFDAFPDSTVNISGGTVGNGFDASDGSTVNITGGTVGRGFDAFTGSTVNISGGEFFLNGNVVEDFSSGFTLSDSDLLTGTLEDGSVFIFSAQALDRLNDVNLIATSTPTIDTTPQTISTTSALRSLGVGQTLSVQTGGELLNNFTVVNATLNVDGGSVGNFAEVARAQINISNGTVGNDFDAHNDSTVNISGGSVGDGFDANNGSTINISAGNVGTFFRANDGSNVNISGGEVGAFFDANSGSTVTVFGGTIGSNFDVENDSTVNISGGEFGNFFEVQDGGTVNISGGIFGNSFDARDGSSVNLFATEFSLNGSLIDASEIGETFTILDRGDDVILSGVFADGTTFDFELNSSTQFSNTRDSFASGSTLTITHVAAVPEPGCGLTLATMSLVLLVQRRRALR